MRTRVAIRWLFFSSLLFSLVLLVFSHGAFAQVGVSVSVSFGPPPLPVYEQPLCPGEGYMWIPGYWAYDDVDGYYWVPGTWVEAPEPGYLWTPGWWGWNDGVYVWNAGYWGPHVGFYGGIDYGFGYFGNGFGGGEWRGNTFFYNTAVVHVNTTVIRNVYVNNTVIENNNSHVAFNGGQGGVQAHPTAQEEQYSHERHIPAVAAQNQHVQEARNNPQLRASVNRGKPPVAATVKPADFKTGAEPAREAGGEYKAPPANAAKGNEARPGNEGGAPANAPSHASDLQPPKFTPPNTGNAATDNKYQQQQQQLAAKENKENQKLQQQQEKEHQQAAKKNYNDTQKQQMEQRHAQQTQQLQQKHATEQRQMEQRQATPRAENKPPAEKR